VVNAAGAWARRVGQLAGLDLPITTWKHDAAFLPPAEGPRTESSDRHRFHQLMYFRPETGGLTRRAEDGNPLGLSPDR
jgi:glycine/D-amino acid oxidase-like deaminating enzyme